MGQAARPAQVTTHPDIYLPHILPVSYRSSDAEQQARLDAVALRIARLRGKTALIKRLTGWGTVRARELYQSTTGKRPPSGGGYSCSAAIIRQSPRIHLHATLFASCYHSVTEIQAQSDQLPGEIFLTAYDIYTSQAAPTEQIAPVQLEKPRTTRRESGPPGRKRSRRNVARQPILSINDAALVLWDLTAQVAYLTYCRECQAYYFRPTEELIGQMLEDQASLKISEISRMTTCPMCQLKDRWHCRRCGTALTQPGTLCNHCPPD